MYKLFGEDFYAKTSQEELLKTIQLLDKKLGNVEEYTLGEWETFVSRNSNETKGHYVLSYQVKRTHKNVTEIITLSREKGEIKIVGYNVDVNLIELID